MPVTSLNTVAGNPAVASVSTTDYVGNYIYQDGSLKMILLPEGYWQSGHYHYYLKDHLGSNRVVLRDDNTLLERNHYYPSGMRFGESAVSGGSVQPYRHTGHEMQAMHGLNWIDNGARMRSVNLPIFTTPDPLAEKYYNISPYAWCGNNPVNRIDPTGMIWEDPKEAERLNKSINNRIESIDKNSTKIQAQIDKGGLSEKMLAKLESRLAENSQKTEMLKQSFADIEAIGNATETYKLGSPSASDGTHNVARGSDGIITIEGSNTGLYVHEIRHVGQSIKAGGVKFNKDGKLINAATSLPEARKNEINAYQTQYSFDGSYPAGASSLKDINGTSLMRIRTDDGRVVYENLEDKKK